MKLLFVSDIHGSPESLKRLLAQRNALAPDQMVLLGDVLYHGPRNPLRADYAPQEVVALLNPLKERILAVRGNCDCEVDQMLLEFPMMADFSQILTDSTRFFLTHGHLWTPDRLPPIPVGTVFASGHTHLPGIELLESGVIAFNPGSISLPKGGFPASFGLWDGNELSVRELDSGRVMFSRILK